MGFSVDAARLGGLPDQLDRLRQHALLGEQYVSDGTKLSYGGVLDAISADHEGTVQQVRDFLDKLARKTAGNGGEAIRIAIGYYQCTDTRAAAALDAGYPGRPVDIEDHRDRADRLRASRGAFDDDTYPPDRYVSPPDYSGQFQDEPGALACVSPTAFGRQVIISATELAAKLGVCERWDPYEAVLKPLTGDWSRFRACADVFDHVAAAVGDMSGNAGVGAGAVPQVWTGNAADGVVVYLDRVRDELAAAVATLKGIGSAYEDAAEAAFENFTVLGHLLNDLIDAAIALVAAAAVGAATEETVIGGLVGGAVAAFAAYQVAKKIQEITEWWHVIDSLWATLRSVLHGGGLIDSTRRLPEVAEAHLRLPGAQGVVGQPKVGNPTR